MVFPVHQTLLFYHHSAVFLELGISTCCLADVIFVLSLFGLLNFVCKNRMHHMKFRSDLYWASCTFHPDSLVILLMQSSAI